MKVGHEYDRFREKVGPVLKSKLEEFSILGYSTITEQDLWNFLTTKKWRKPNTEIHLYEIVQEILRVKIGEYMNFASVEASRQTDFSFGSEEDRNELLK